MIASSGAIEADRVKDDTGVRARGRAIEDVDRDRKNAAVAAEVDPDRKIGITGAVNATGMTDQAGGARNHAAIGHRHRRP